MNQIAPLLLLLFTSASLAAPLPAEKAEALRTLRSQIRTWAATCPDGSLTNTPGDCPMGDNVVFAGLSCLSGEKSRCDDVRRSQGIDGEWFRSPEMVDKARENGKATFSRDQGRGVLAYLVATQDVDAARRWMDSIKKNGDKLCRKSERGWDACNTSFGWWVMMESVWDFLGLEKAGGMKRIHHLKTRIYKPMEARLQRNDYPLHLNALSVFLRQEISRRSGKPDPQPKYLKKMARIIQKRSPENPFFHFLRYGVTERSADLVLKHCPATAPKLDQVGVQRDWIWQRSPKDVVDGTEIPTWEHPGGHECIFMINLLVGAES